MRLRHRSRHARRRGAAPDPAAAGRERDQARHRAAERARGSCRSRRRRQGDKLWIEVRDNGVGLSAERARPAAQRRRPLEHPRPPRVPVRQRAPARVLGRTRRPGGSDAEFHASTSAARPDAAASGAWHDRSPRRRGTRVLVADDEPLARERLRMLLAAEPWLELVAECQNGPEAIDAIQALAARSRLPRRPDAGRHRLRSDRSGRRRRGCRWWSSSPPSISYALRAFDVHALDYLLKPFDRERFQQALGRARQQLERAADGDLERRLLALVQDLKPTPQRARSLRDQVGRPGVLRQRRRDRLDRSGRQLRQAARRRPRRTCFRETMNAIEAQLDPETFFRIHRCHIVNIERVRSCSRGSTASTSCS